MNSIKLKVCILSSSAGGGHMSAANAIKEHFEKNNVVTEVFDTFEIISPFLKWLISDGYDFLVFKTPNLYRFAYETANSKSASDIITEINGLLSKKILSLINSFKPDLIISTHPFSTEIISKLKTKKKINLPIICVITDYFPHRTWVSPYVDAYVCGHESMTDELLKLKVPKEKIFPVGIPVKKVFYENHDDESEKKIIKRSLGLDENLPTILIMAGSMGYGENVIEIYKELNYLKTDFQIIIITGKNIKLFQNFKIYCQKFSNKLIIQEIDESKTNDFFQLRRFFYRSTSKIQKKFDEFKTYIKSNIKENPEKKSSKIYKKNSILIHFTSEIYKYMFVSDVIVTKPGGLTTTEAICCNLPIVIVNPIPGQEEKNAQFLIENGIGYKPESPRQCANFIEELFNVPEKFFDIKKKCATFKKSDCVDKILELSISFCKKYTEK